MSEIKERPILFSAPMVRAILEGRKTVTRRAVKGAGLSFLSDFTPEYVAQPENHFCPHGNPGDRLWVRETWGVISHDFDEHGNMIDWKPDRPASPIREMRFGQGYYSGHVIYRADGEAVWAGDDDGGGDDRSAWKPSIHMPRAACRILLEITEVRVERLQDIGEEQARAEGCFFTDYGRKCGHTGSGWTEVGNCPAPKRIIRSAMLGCGTKHPVRTSALAQRLGRSRICGKASAVPGT
ncbi:hypothetical protein [Pseudomonas antarctica]|uniref:hypothetical protein n=1 Tax=Pseudomonas antarctica TaxID=219572 RepID=UPI003F756531